MKLIIEVDEKRFEEIKQIANAQFELKNKTEAQIIAHGTPYNPTGDCISREALKEKLKERYYNDGLNIVTAIELIDNAPPVPQVTVFTENADEKAVADMKAELQSVIGARPNEQIAWEQGYEAGLAQGKHDKMSDNKSLCDTCLYGHCCESSDAETSFANHSVCHGYVADVIDENEKGGAE